MRISRMNILLSSAAILAFAAYAVQSTQARMVADYRNGKYAKASPVLGAELVTNGTFDSDTTGVTASGVALSAPSGQLILENESANFGYGYISVATEIGERFVFGADVIGASTSWVVRVGDSTDGNTNTKVNETGTTTGTTISESFIATANPTYIRLGLNNNTIGETATFDNISVREIISHKATRTTYSDLHVGGGDMSGLITAHDSDGTLKYNAHNLLTYSEDFSNAAWQKLSGGAGSTAVVTSNFGTAPDGTMTADRLQLDLNGGTGSGDFSYIKQVIAGSVDYTRAIWMKLNSGSDTDVLLEISGSPGLSTVTDEWQLFSLSGDANADVDIALRGSQSTSDTADLLVWGAHLYRTDITMQDVPVEFRVNGYTTYVPTTSAARYLPFLRPHTFDGTTWVKGGIQVTEAATNLVEDSNAVLNHNAVRATRAENQATSPTGAVDAGSITEDNSAGDHRLDVATISVTSGTQYTFSAHFKPNGRNWVRIVLASAQFGTSYANFDVDAGVVGTTTGIDSTTIEDLGSGWIRCSVTATATGTGSAGTNIQLATANNTISYTGDETSGVYVFGMQFETGSIPTPYIPTYGATVARAAFNPEVKAAYTGYDVDGLSIFMDGKVSYGDEGVSQNVILLRWQDSAEERIYTAINTGATLTGLIDQFQVAGNVYDKPASFPPELSPGVNVPFNIASRHEPDNVNGALDGTALTENTTPTALADLSATDLEIGAVMTGIVNSTVIYPPLADTQMEAATA